MKSVNTYLIERLKLNKDTKVNQIEMSDILNVLEKRLSDAYAFIKWSRFNYEQGNCLKYTTDNNTEYFFIIWSDNSFLSYFVIYLNEDNKISIGLVNEYRSSYGNTDTYFFDFIDPTQALKTSAFKSFDVTNNINDFVENIINMLNEGLKLGKSKNLDSILMIFEDTYKKCKNLIKNN